MNTKSVYYCLCWLMIIYSQLLPQTSNTSYLLQGGKKGDSFRLVLNNINLPLTSNGILADVDVESDYQSPVSGALFDGISFLFSGGFYLGGKNGNDIWVNAMASSSRDEHYLPGTYKSGKDDPRAQLYLVKKSDPDFHQSWSDWKDAVELGAHFYDGDNDGIYNPVDKNSNGVWDEDEDKPEILLDFSIWCVYHDGLPSELRSFNTIPPLGIEIRQTIYGFETNGILGNVLFLRYEILNTGIYSAKFDSVYFSAWSDPDIGKYDNDLVGCDTTLNAGFAYDNDYDSEYGNSPCFLTSIINSPIKRNMNRFITSFTHLYYYSPTMRLLYEDEYWNILRGLGLSGHGSDPCNYEFGEVRGGVDCNNIPQQYLFSGDPVEDYGWICTKKTDHRMMVNTGSFELIAGEQQTVEVAYVVGRDSTSLLSVNEAKRIDQIIQELYNNNFLLPAQPPAVKPVIEAEEDRINLVWETSTQFEYNEEFLDNKGNPVWDFRFEGFEVFMHRTPDLRDSVNGHLNKIRIASFDLENDIGDILIEDYKTGIRTLKYNEGIQLKPWLYADSSISRIKFSIITDPFTGGDLIKGKPYFISIKAYAINYADIRKVFPERDIDHNYLIPANSVYGFIESSTGVLNSINGITAGESVNVPSREGVPIEHVEGPSTAAGTYTVIDRNLVDNAEYEVTFSKDTNSYKYKMLWSVTNKKNGNKVITGVGEYNQTSPIYIADGVMLSIDWLEPKLLNEEMNDGLAKWFKREVDQRYFSSTEGFGSLYIGEDIDTVMFARFIPILKHSTVMTFDKTRRVEIRFGEPSKAYRYFKKSNSIRYLYPDPEKPEQGSGFVDVPFSAWVKDDRYGEKYQLATAYLELQQRPDDSLNFNDGKWNPGHDISQSAEYIVIFSSLYDPTGSNVVYTGTGSGSNTSKFANLPLGYRINRDDPNYFITDSMAAVAESPWFDAMYLVALEVADSIAMEDFNPTGTYVINRNYPLTELDKFIYTPSLELTSSEKKNLFDKVNVVPNPFFGYNELAGTDPANQHVTFINLPEKVTIKIYNLAGALVRTLITSDKSNDKSPFLKWDLENENGYRVGSGMYLALVTSPGLGEKVLKFAIVQAAKYK